MFCLKSYMYKDSAKLIMCPHKYTYSMKLQLTLYVEWAHKEGLHAPQKLAIFRTSYASHEKPFCYNILTLYIFEKLMVLTLERVKTDFDHINLVTVVVQ